jgi:hypothetical protein
MRIYWAVPLSAAFILVNAGCERAEPTSDDILQATVDETTTMAAEGNDAVSALKSEVEDLEQRVAEAERIAKEAQDRADEAHDLAQEAESKAREACKPYGYQYGCGNSGE